MKLWPDNDWEAHPNPEMLHYGGEKIHVLDAKTYGKCFNNNDFNSNWRNLLTPVKTHTKLLCWPWVWSQGYEGPTHAERRGRAGWVLGPVGRDQCVCNKGTSGHFQSSWRHPWTSESQHKVVWPLEFHNLCLIALPSLQHTFTRIPTFPSTSQQPFKAGKGTEVKWLTQGHTDN